MFGGTGHKKGSLAYKNQRDHDKDGTDGNEDDEMGPLSLLIRILLFPFVIPVLIYYVLFHARGTPIAAELDDIDNESIKFDASDLLITI